MSMITNLFSSFDPSTNFRIPLNWIRTSLFVIILFPNFWVINSKISKFFIQLKTTLHKEFKILLSKENKGASFIFITLFFFILINNFFGLFPYIFTSSRHLSITLTLALPLWLSFILFGWLKKTLHILAHLVPNGTPGPLIPFIVLIELVRNIIRPITLSVRLIANIMAGHLLMTLLGNQTAIATNIILVGLILTQILLLTLETAVAIIQSYVFAVLSTLYSREIDRH